jgi:parvulin-like peptidyl-prolyl isomerase
LRRLILVVVATAALAACSAPVVALPTPNASAATVDGHDISIGSYRARLKVSQARDPYLGLPGAVPSPVATDRLEDFTIEQLIEEAIVAEEAASHGIKVNDKQVATRVKQLQDSAGATTFAAALERNGFTALSFREYERALLTEVELLKEMAKQRIDAAASDLKSGQTFSSVVSKWNDDTGTAARDGEVGWIRLADLPEPPLRDAVDTVAPGSTTGIVQTDRGYVIAKVLDKRDDRLRLAVVLVLAPTVDLFSPQGTPAWFTKFIADREARLRNEGKITIRVGSYARS